MNTSHPAPTQPAVFHLTRDTRGQLVFTGADGVAQVGVSPVRVFPITEPQRWISLVDAEGHELLLIEDPALLPPDLRETLEHELSRAEFVPRIRRIKAASPQNDPALWSIDTDRGSLEITIQNEADVRRLGPNEALVVDRHGIRFLIPDTRQLDFYSRRVLERFI